MADSRVTRLANLLVSYCVGVKPGDKVAIHSSFLGKPLLLETVRSTIRAGGHPLIIWHDGQTQEILMKEGNDEQLTYVPEPMEIIYKKYDCQINIEAPANSRTMSGVDPERQRLAYSAFKEINEIYTQRSASGEFRWVIAQYPTDSGAQDADMSLCDFEDFIYGACFVDVNDPISEWERFSEFQQTLVNWLIGKEHVQLKGPHVDLSLSIKDRRFINSDGHKNMPSGEIFTSPQEDSVNGWVRFTYPAIHAGREVGGIELRFEDGRVVKATAEKNEQFLKSMLAVDDGASYLGEFAIGTNHGIQRFTKSILFDEKIGGTIHLALGNSFPEANGENRSSLHWDMICDMRDGGKIWVDDELFYDSGRFSI